MLVQIIESIGIESYKEIVYEYNTKIEQLKESGLICMRGEHKMKSIFKRATKDDIKGIITLCNECFNENTDLDYAFKIFDETKNDPNQIYLNGFIDNKIIAHTKITIIPTIYEDMNTYAIINHFCVKPEYRRHHIATEMLEEITKICKEMDCKSIKLWSKNFRIPAQECYKYFGFELIDAGFCEKEIFYEN